MIPLRPVWRDGAPMAPLWFTWLAIRPDYRSLVLERRWDTKCRVPTTLPGLIVAAAEDMVRHQRELATARVA